MNQLRLNVPVWASNTAALLILVLCIANGGLAHAQVSNFYTPIPGQGIFLKNLTYGYDPSEVLDLCRPESDAKRHPGLVLIHGGGWTHGDNGGLMGNWCQAFAKLGFVVANINYRLDNLDDKNLAWPAFQIGDVQLAIRWMRYHAVELNLRPKQLCAYGTSAGAYLTVFAATQQRIYPSDVNWIAPMIPVYLSCVIDGFGPVDLTASTYQPKIITKLLGATYDEDPGLYEDDSPLFYVNARTPPTLVIHGTNDHIVSIAQSEELVKRLQLELVPVQFIRYDGGHAYEGLDASEIQTIFDKIAHFLNAESGA